MVLAPPVRIDKRKQGYVERETAATEARNLRPVPGRLLVRSAQATCHFWCATQSQ